MAQLDVRFRACARGGGHTFGAIDRTAPAARARTRAGRLRSGRDGHALAGGAPARGCVRSGDVLISEGGEGGGIWVLVSGKLQVRKGDMAVNVIDQPGAIIGEISVLLGNPAGASIVAMEPTRARYASDGGACCAATPSSPASSRWAWPSASTT